MKKNMLNKKGASGEKMIDWGVGVLVLVAVFIQVFGADGFGHSNWSANAPALAKTVMPLMVIVGGIFFLKSKK